MARGDRDSVTGAGAGVVLLLTRPRQEHDHDQAHRADRSAIRELER